MQPSETARWPEKGQFWASLNPLFLIELIACNENNSVAGIRWTPNEDRGEILWVGPMRENFRYLWHVTMHERKKIDPTGIYNPRVGDIFILHWDKDSNPLIFIGPETNDEVVQVCADWRFFLYPADNTMTLFQPGPGRQTPPGRTAWDHLKDG